MSKKDEECYLQSTNQDNVINEEIMNSLFLDINKEYDNISDMQDQLSILKSFKKIKDESNINVSFIKESDLFIRILSNSNKYYDIDSIKKEIFRLKILGFRKVKGDGNCFYRTIIYSVLENIIYSQNKQKFQFFLIDLNKKLKGEEFKYFLKINSKLEVEKAFKTVIQLFYLIYKVTFKELNIDKELNINKDTNDDNILLALNLLVLAYNNIAFLDLCLLGYIKIKLMKFMKENENCCYSKEFPIKLGNLLPAEYEDSKGNPKFKEFYSEFLLKLWKDAEKIVIYLIPYVFDISLALFIVEPAKINIELFEKQNDYSNSKLVINVLYYGFHYEILYLNNDYDKIALLNNIDVMNEERNNKIFNNDFLDNLANNLIESNDIISIYDRLLKNIQNSKYFQNDFDFSDVFSLLDTNKINLSNDFPKDDDLKFVKEKDNDLLKTLGEIPLKKLATDKSIEDEYLVKYLAFIQKAKSNLIASSSHEEMTKLDFKQCKFYY